MAFDAYMPVMLAVMEIPGCLVALYLVARLRPRITGGYAADGRLPQPWWAETRHPPALSGNLTAQAERGIEEEFGALAGKARASSQDEDNGVKTAARRCVSLLTQSCCRKFSSARGSFSSSAASSSA